MKTQISGSGVKAANRFQIVREIEGKKCWSTYHIERMKSAELIPFWNYKAEGLNLPDAIKQLIAAINHRDQVQKEKPKRFITARKGKYLDMFKKKQKLIEQWRTNYNSLEPVQNYSKYGYGNYKYKHRTFAMPGNITATVTWFESHDWDFYSKRYGRPKSEYTNRAVEFKTVGTDGNPKVIHTYGLETFAGNFVERAIASFYNAKNVRYSKELAPVQLANYFTLIETHRINGYRTFQRLIGKMLWDYAILCTTTGETYHARQPENLVPGLRKKLQEKLDIETETITKETGFALGFCETGMRNFCADNNLDFDGSYSRRDLRNIVIENRLLNCRKYNNELRKIGIILNCK